MQFYLTGFQLDQMALGGRSIGGKSKKLLRVLSTLLMLFDMKSVLLKIFVFLRIALKYLLQTDAIDFKNLGIRQVGL